MLKHIEWLLRPDWRWMHMLLMISKIMILSMVRCHYGILEWLLMISNGFIKKWSSWMEAVRSSKVLIGGLLSDEGVYHLEVCADLDGHLLQSLLIQLPHFTVRNSAFIILIITHLLFLKQILNYCKCWYYIFKD